MDERSFTQALVDWYGQNKRDLPWRRTTNPYYIWLSEIMLQQTQVDTVQAYYLRFIEALPTIESLALADSEEVYKLWEGLGYYRRAKHLKEAAQMVMTDFDGIFPNTYETIIKLKGIGPYTASAIASIAFHQPKGVVDGNILRIVSRVYNRQDNIATEQTKKTYQEIMDRLIAYGDPSDFNQGMMDLGATVCTPKNPRCEVCPVQNLCEAFHCNTQKLLPVNIKNRSKEDLYFITAILSYDDRYFLIKNQPGGLLENLYGFVQYQVESPISFEEAFYDQYGLNIRLDAYLQEVKHVFTHKVWHMNVYTGSLLEDPKENLYTRDQLMAIPIATAHQKLFAL